MVAASPERHDSSLQANPVEVQSYQPPWKVLSDFALQSDIEQPAFQQLVSASNMQNTITTTTIQTLPDLTAIRGTTTHQSIYRQFMDIKIAESLFCQP